MEYNEIIKKAKIGYYAIMRYEKEPLKIVAIDRNKNSSTLLCEDKKGLQFWHYNPEIIGIIKDKCNSQPMTETIGYITTCIDGTIRIVYRGSLLGQSKCNDKDVQCYDEQFGLALAMARALKTLPQEHKIVIETTEKVSDYVK